MGGTAKRAGLAVGTGGLSEFTHGTDAFGLKTGLNKIGIGGSGYSPTQVGGENPVAMLSQSGGAPLLTNIALGVKPEEALAGYFGKRSYQEVLQSATTSERHAIEGLLSQLNTIQSNTDLRNKAVQKVVQDFPNIVSMTAPKVAEAKQRAGEEFDVASKQYLDYAMQQTASKYAAGGMVSSGAQVQAQANNAAQMGLQRLDYTTGRGDQQLGLQAQDWQNQYNEANALRNFQQTMLGQGVQQGFSANQAYLNRKQQTDIANAGFQNQAQLQDQQNSNAMLGAIGGLAGTALGGYMQGKGMAAGLNNTQNAHYTPGSSDSFPQGQPTVNSPISGGNSRLNLRY